jgi:hypothetical protein
MERYQHPPEGPEDITPADDVYRDGDEVRIVHGPGQETRIPATEFYSDDPTDKEASSREDRS